MPDTVSTTSLLAMFSTLVLSILFPVVLWLAVRRQDKKATLAVIAGAIGFIIPQMVVRLPLLQLLGRQPDWVFFLSTRRVFALVFYPLTAALVETAGRLAVLGVVLKKRRSFYAALGAGIGHGGAESIGLIGLTYINNIILSVLINRGTLPNLAGLEEALTALRETAPLLFLMAGVERVLVLPLQIALTVLLAAFWQRGRLFAGILCCAGLHFAVDLVAVFMSSQQMSLWLIEGFLLLVALLSIWLIFRQRKWFGEMAIPDDEAEQAVREGY
ncbi:MAG: YhfC family intramembrane metalloprotease [Ruminococcaceae bacterium]|nr:YhfC family intramembrane metalloprotease [Oscillospiraceae bacterium]